MWQRWTTFILAWVSMATPTFCQSGDVDWGSGFDIFSTTMSTNSTLNVVGDDPKSMKDRHSSLGFSPSFSPLLQLDAGADECSVHFSTKAAALSRRLKAQKEEVAYLKARQQGNQAVVENLEQFLGSDLGDRRYEDKIKENIVGIQEDHKSCIEVVEKAEDDLKKQLEGDGLDVFTGMQNRIKEESLVFEDMLRAAADIAGRLERSSRALKSSFTRHLEDIVKIHQ
ncbi:uncharacterized protein si:ch211-142k18.1 isoform X1 [Nothobranchius furzeri]|uniref:Transcript variant X1 n=1 Tax=Nothobranchius furzeri TaxID=105023 RepID=A0A9D2Z5B4_NOTFU|nr:transcript variant X1 [Nothobranchius furzeri]